MNYCQELVDRYLRFYRPQWKQGKGFTATGCTKPLTLAADILMKNTQFSDEELESMIAASTCKLLAQVHSGSAEGRYMLSGNPEIEAIKEFARFFIQEFWKVPINRDRANLSGNKFALFQHTCEFLVREALAPNGNA